MRAAALQSPKHEYSSHGLNDVHFKYIIGDNPHKPEFLSPLHFIQLMISDSSSNLGISHFRISRFDQPRNPSEDALILTLSLQIQDPASSTRKVPKPSTIPRESRSVSEARSGR